MHFFREASMSFRLEHKEGPSLFSEKAKIAFPWSTANSFHALTDELIAYAALRSDQVRVFDFKTKKPRAYLRHNGAQGLATNQQIFVSISPTRIKTWDCQTLKELSDVNVQLGAFNSSRNISAVLFPNARFVAVAKPQEVAIVDLKTGSICSVILDKESSIQDLSLTAADSLLVADSRTGIYELGVKFNLENKESKWCDTKVLRHFEITNAQWVVASQDASRWAVGVEESLGSYSCLVVDLSKFEQVQLFHCTQGKPLCLPSGSLLMNDDCLRFLNFGTLDYISVMPGKWQGMLLPNGEVVLLQESNCLVRTDKNCLVVDFAEMARYREVSNYWKQQAPTTLSALPFAVPLKTIVAEYAYTHQIAQLLFATKPSTSKIPVAEPEGMLSLR
jgi:hypothetical protein